MSTLNTLPETPNTQSDPHTARPPRRRSRQIGTALLLGLTLTGGAIGGGAVGAGLMAQILSPQTAQAAQTTVITSQPIAELTSTNVASTVFRAVSPSVVEIQVAGQTNFGRTASATGSGFVVDMSGLIVTNEHVVDEANTVSVQFSTGDERDATVVGT